MHKIDIQAANTNITKSNIVRSFSFVNPHLQQMKRATVYYAFLKSRLWVMVRAETEGTGFSFYAQHKQTKLLSLHGRKNLATGFF